MSKATLKNTASRMTRFGRAQDGAVATWFAIMLVPMLGFTFGAIKFANLTEQRSSMTDAMDASGLAIARQYEILEIDACDVEAADADDDRDPDTQNKRRLERFGQEFFAENYPEYGQLYRDRDLKQPLDLERDLDFDLTCDDITMSVTAYTDMGGILGSYFGLKSVELNLETNVTLFQQSKMEVALVLDVTGSMCFPGAPGNYGYPRDCAPVGSRRIDELRDAVQGMLDHPKVFADKDESDRVKFSVVPFNTFVNVGANYANTVDGRSDSVGSWMDGWGGTTPRALYHGRHFLHAYEDGATVPDYPTDGLAITPTPKSSPIMRVSDRKVNHFDLFRSVGDGGDPTTTWKGCVETRPFPLDEIASPAGEALPDLELARAFTRPSAAASNDATVAQTMDAAWRALGDRPPANVVQSAANSLFVPAFAGDGPDCAATQTNECMTFAQREDDAAPGADQDHRGANWGRGLTVLRRPDGSLFGRWEDGPIPRRLHEYFGMAHANAGFIQDKTFLSREDGLASIEDKQRYRNLLFAMYLQGLNRLDANQWPARDPNNGGFSHHLNTCASPKGSYTFDQDMVDAMDELGFHHCRDELNLRRAYVGVYRPNLNLYFGRYENLQDSTWTRGPISPSSYETASAGPNSGCSGPILPLTNQKDEIEDVLAALTPQGGTNTAVGLAWGWRTLTHEAPFIEAIDPDSVRGKQWYKIAILLSDGENSDTPSGYQQYSAFGYGNEDRLRADQAGITSGEAIDYKTIRMCHRMRSEGIKVYAIGFAIDANSAPDRMLKACAVDDDAYFLADNASALNAAFDDIADQITDLSVSR